jgi:hypothetical protein
MSLGMVIKAPEGIVLSAESRVTLAATPPAGPPIHVNFDNATKLFGFNSPHNYVGVVTYGLAAIGLRTAHSFLPEFEATLPGDRLTIAEFAKQLSNFYLAQWNVSPPPNYTGPQMTFLVAGYDNNQPYGRVYQFDIPNVPNPVEHQSGGFGLTWGGQREMVDRLLQGYDNNLPGLLTANLGLNPTQQTALNTTLQQLQLPIPLQALPLQDCVNLALFFLNTTILGQRLTVGIRGCGGEIDVAVVTRREGFKFLRRKELHA